jgi:hypothetical protein
LEANVYGSVLLLAETELYRPRSGFPQYLLWVAALGAVVLAVIGFHFWNISRRPRDRRGESATSDDILAELYKVHELTRIEQALLATIARDQHLSQSAVLFIDPDPLIRAADRPELDANTCRSLRYKLFGALD